MEAEKVKANFSSWDLLNNYINLLENIFSQLPLKLIIIDKNKDIIYSNIADMRDYIGLNYDKLLEENKINKKGKSLIINNKRFIIDNHDINEYKVLFLKEKKR